jgi:hypothetical protein
MDPARIARPEAANEIEDDEVEAVLAEFDGDPRRAIRALLDDIAALAEDRAEGRNFLKAYGHLEVVK